VSSGQAPRILDRVKRTASTLVLRCGLVGVAEILEGDALNIAIQSTQQGQGHRTVHAAADAEQNPRPRRQPPPQGLGDRQREGH
jgi:hypothetical protein